MGRLIDADGFKKFLQALCNAGAPYEEIIQLLEKEPTAYDIEKVVAKLENHRDCYEKVIGQVIVNDYDINLERVDLLNHTIDIVRKGGVE